MVAPGIVLGGYGAGQMGLQQYLLAQQQQQMQKQQLQQAMQAAAAQGLIPGAMRALYGQNGGQPQNIPNAGVFAPPGPGMPPGGVSPSAGLPPAGGAPGGTAGPSPAAVPYGAGGASSGMPQGMDMAKLWQYLASTGAPPGQQAAAGQDIYKMMLPEQRLNDAMARTQMQQQGAMDRAKLTWEERGKLQNEIQRFKQIGGANAPKLKDDPQFRALEDQLKAATANHTSAPTEDNLIAVHEAAKQLAEYAKSKGSTAPAGKPAEVPAASKYTMGQIIPGADGKKYKVIDITDPNDPGVELVP